MFSFTLVYRMKLVNQSNSAIVGRLLQCMLFVTGEHTLIFFAMNIDWVQSNRYIRLYMYVQGTRIQWPPGVKVREGVQRSDSAPDRTFKRQRFPLNALALPLIKNFLRVKAPFHQILHFNHWWLLFIVCGMSSYCRFS